MAPLALIERALLRRWARRHGLVLVERGHAAEHRRRVDEEVVVVVGCAAGTLWAGTVPDLLDVGRP